MAFVAQLASVAVGEWYFHLGEEDLAQRLAKILWHVRSVGELIEATLASRLCSTVAFCCFVARW